MVYMLAEQNKNAIKNIISNKCINLANYNQQKNASREIPNGIYTGAKI